MKIAAIDCWLVRWQAEPCLAGLMIVTLKHDIDRCDTTNGLTMMGRDPSLSVVPFKLQHIPWRPVWQFELRRSWTWRNVWKGTDWVEGSDAIPPIGLRSILNYVLRFLVLFAMCLTVSAYSINTFYYFVCPWFIRSATMQPSSRDYWWLWGIQFHKKKYKKY